MWVYSIGRTVMSCWVRHVSDSLVSSFFAEKLYIYCMPSVFSTLRQCDCLLYKYVCRWRQRYDDKDSFVVVAVFIFIFSVNFCNLRPVGAVLLLQWTIGPGPVHFMAGCMKRRLNWVLAGRFVVLVQLPKFSNVCLGWFAGKTSFRHLCRIMLMWYNRICPCVIAVN